MQSEMKHTKNGLGRRRAGINRQAVEGGDQVMSINSIALSPKLR